MSSHGSDWSVVEYARASRIQLVHPEKYPGMIVGMLPCSGAHVQFAFTPFRSVHPEKRKPKRIPRGSSIEQYAAP
eukprot:953730-Pyramimonas_sp.AAC.1